MKRIITLLSLAVASATAVSTVAVAQSQIARNNLPIEATPCIQERFKSVASWFDMDASRYTQFSKTELDGTTYYLIGVFIKKSDDAIEMVVSIDPKKQCSVLFFNPQGEFMSRTPSVPESVSNALALGDLQNYMQSLGGLQAYQRKIIQEARRNGNKIPVTPEDVWAMNRLGVRLPPNIKLEFPPKYQK